jgi:hypothetical protein
MLVSGTFTKKTLGRTLINVTDRDSTDSSLECIEIRC